VIDYPVPDPRPPIAVRGATAAMAKSLIPFTIRHPTGAVAKAAAAGRLLLVDTST
jgi:hypothetical protein